MPIWCSCCAIAAPHAIHTVKTRADMGGTANCADCLTGWCRGLADDQVDAHSSCARARADDAS